MSKRTLRDYLRSRFSKVGVGYYTNVPFVHLDVRKKRSAFWVDTSGSGQKARYVANPTQFIRDESRRLKRGRKAQKIPTPPRKVVAGPLPLGPDAIVRVESRELRVERTSK